MTTTTCGTVEDCLGLILKALKALDQTSFLEWAPAVAAAAVSLLAVGVSLFVFGIERRRVLRTERQALRDALRIWFAGLSRSADKKVRAGHRALDSQIKEDIGPVGKREIQSLMTWALNVHRETWAIEDSNRTKKAEMQARRMYAKWMFRDLVAEWVLRPTRTRRKISNLTKQGYGAIAKIKIDDPKVVKKAYRPFDPKSTEEILVRFQEFG